MTDRISVRLTAADCARLALIREHLQPQIPFLDRSDLVRFALEVAEQRILAERET